MAVTSRVHARRELLDAVGVLLSQTRSALFITGPGLSADSGLVQYRGMPGVQKKQPRDGRLLEAALSIDTLEAKPTVTWRYLLDMDAHIRSLRPSRGHEILVELERALPRSTIMTVNIDRLHQRAGSRNVIEMHGALHDLLCKRCEMSTRHESFASLAIPPVCRTCGGPVRPDMPFFGETLPVDPFTRLEAELEAGFDIVFAIGVQAIYPYLARPMLLAKSAGVPTVEVGTQRTDLSDVIDFRFGGSPSRVLDLIARVYAQLTGTTDSSRVPERA